ncbi:MAG: dienelactone hydrolase family protein [Actinomycetota bacterium]|nr:dienelactone hydrolase family protein [Actinomycetota bacterium]
MQNLVIDHGAGVRTGADLGVPDDATGLVVFAHGSGSSRHSPRNRMVAERLRGRGLATLLVDLLTEDEDAGERRGGRLRFDVELLAERLSGAVDAAVDHPDLAGLPVGLFGASTGAAAALVAAARDPGGIAAVVSRGGRPDLAGTHLREVRSPTLLLVGGEDTQVIGLNEEARGHLTGPSDLVIIPGASHLFEEPGALEQVAERAGDWFVRHLAR